MTDLLTMLCTSVAAALACRRAQRVIAETSLRVTELLAGPPAASPPCWRCRGPLEQSQGPRRGQTHYCPRCELWTAVTGS